jgi:hypothetical protein
MRRSILGLAGALALASVATAEAQVVPHRFQIGPRLAWLNYASQSGLKGSGLVGVDATYFLSAKLGVGLSVDFTRPQTDGRYHPAEFTFGDTTFIYQATYPITVFQYQLMGIATLGSGSISPYLTGGVGQYRMFIDPQSAMAPRQVTHALLSVGGGVNVRLGSSGGLRLEVRDFMYTGYDLNEINTVNPRFNPRRFPDVAPVPNDKCYRETCRLNNLQFALGFTFVPGGR